MKRSIQEIVELLVFGLIAVLIGTALLWVVGWAIGGLGALFKLVAGLIWSLLRFIVPIAVVGAAVYALVRLLQGPRRDAAATGSTTTGTTTTGSTTGAGDGAASAAGSGAAGSTPSATPGTTTPGTTTPGTTTPGTTTTAHAPDAPPPPADPMAPAQHTRPASAPDASQEDVSRVGPVSGPASDVDGDADRRDDEPDDDARRAEGPFGDDASEGQRSERGDDWTDAGDEDDRR